MDSELWFSRHERRLWAAAVEDRRIVEIHAPRPTDAAQCGAVYRARVQRVVPRLKAAFVLLAPGLEGYLEAPAEAGQELTVQVRREAHGGKRARVTLDVEFSARMLALRRHGAGVAVSRRIEDAAERQRLERWARATGAAGLVLRSAAAGASAAVLGAERDELQRRFARIADTERSVRAPALLRPAPGLIERLIRDYAGRGLRGVVVETDDDEARAAAAGGAGGSGWALRRYRHPGSMFRETGIEEAVQRASNPSVALACGGSLTIEPTRALWAVDVDSGAARVPRTAVNREAARRIAYEIRLRDMAGTILIDFLSMRDRGERDELEAALRRALRADRRYLRLTGWTGLGLCELARRREGPSLLGRLGSIPPA